MAPGEEAPLADLDPLLLLGRLPDAVLAADAGGRIVYANAAAERLLGAAPASLRGRPLESIVPEALRSTHRAAFQRYLDTGESRILGRQLRLPALRDDGEEVEVELVISAFGGPEGLLFLGVLRDLSDRVELEHQRLLTRYLRTTAELALTLGPRSHRELADVAPTVLALLGRELGWEVAALWQPDGDRLRCTGLWDAERDERGPFTEESLRRRFDKGEGLPGRVWSDQDAAWIADVRDDPNFPRADAARARGLRAGAAFPILADGECLGVLELLSTQRREPDEDLLTVMTTIGGALGQWVTRNRAAAEADYRAALLASEAEAIIDAVLVVDPGGHVISWNERFIEMSGVEPGQLRNASGADLVDLALQRVVEQDAMRELIRRVSENPDERRRMELNLVDGRAVDCYTSPLHGAGGISYGRAWYFRDITEQKRTLQRMAHLARTLQASLLPPGKPEIPGFDVAAAFRPATVDLDVGGDFYDVFPVGGTSYGFVIGDVCGKGAEAAALTALARYTLRASAMHTRRPSMTLVGLNEAVLQQVESDRFLTVIAGRVRRRPGGAEVTVSIGGHPLPLVLRADGTTEWVGRSGTLVGVVPRIQVHDVTLRLGEGDALVLYTDGVTEARSPDGGMLGEEGLLDAVRGATGEPAGTICGRILEAVDAVTEGRSVDDQAVLVLWVPPARPDLPPVPPGSGSTPGQ